MSEKEENLVNDDLNENISSEVTETEEQKSTDKVKKRW